MDSHRAKQAISTEPGKPAPAPLMLLIEQLADDSEGLQNRVAALVSQLHSVTADAPEPTSAVVTEREAPQQQAYSPMADRIRAIVSTVRETQREVDRVRAKLEI